MVERWGLGDSSNDMHLSLYRKTRPQSQHSFIKPRDSTTKKQLEPGQLSLALLIKVGDVVVFQGAILSHKACALRHHLDFKHN